VADKRTRAVAFDFVGAAASVAVIGLLAWWSKQPLLFPSVGPTLMLVLDSRSLPSARPLNILVGHYVGLLAGLVAIAATGLLGAPPVTQAGTTGPRVLAAALALALTASALRLLGTSHPPAGATTLIVALGVLDSPPELIAMCVSVLLLTGLSMVLRLPRLRPAGV